MIRSFHFLCALALLGGSACMAADWPLNTAKDPALVVHGEIKVAHGVSAP